MPHPQEESRWERIFYNGKGKRLQVEHTYGEPGTAAMNS
jgi:hypothetical protein